MSELETDYDYSEDSEYSSERSSADTEFTDNLHSSDDPEEYSEEEPDQHVRRRFYKDLSPPTRKLLKESSQAYPPERWPPILDFLFVFSSFVAAVVAAYFTIF